MSDTPRTDAEVMYADCADSCLEVYVTRRADGKSHDGDIVSGDFARTLERELSAARAELATAREHEAAALSGQRQLLAKYDGALRQLEVARESLREAILREIVWSAHCHCSLTDMSMDEYTAMLSKWRKAAGMDATAGEVKA